jgi:hypothetical protein
MQVQHGEQLEVGWRNPKGTRETKRRNDIQICNKSTKLYNSKKETKFPAPSHACCDATSVGQGVNVAEVVAPVLEADSDVCIPSGPLGERNIDGDFLYPLGDGLGLVDPQPDPILSDPCVVGLNAPYPNLFGLEGVDDVHRFSSISELEDVFRPHRPKASNRSSKIFRTTSTSKPQLIGVPRCVQFLEAVQSGSSRLHRRRAKSGGPSMGTIEVVGVSSSDVPILDSVCAVEAQALCPRVDAISASSLTPGVTPSSGLNLISKSDNSVALDTPPTEPAGDRIKVIEAAKLLAIQKEVGFSFEVEDGVTLNELTLHEDCDRIKKMEWEQKNGDQ